MQGVAACYYGVLFMQTAVMYSNCATALDMLGEYEQAVEVLKEAIRKSQLHGSSDPEHMAMLYTNIGAIRTNQGMAR